MVLIGNGTLLMIQNMTWGGAQGFSTKPTDPFYVPCKFSYVKARSRLFRPESNARIDHHEQSLSTLAGSGVFGTTHTERGLTWVSIDLSGHMVPQYAPSAAYRHLEFLLGRVESLSSVVPFTTDPYPQPNVTTIGNTTSIGNGTAPPSKRYRFY